MDGSQQCRQMHRTNECAVPSFFSLALGGGERTAGIMAAGNEELPRRPYKSASAPVAKPRLAVATFGKTLATDRKRSNGAAIRGRDDVL